MPRFADFTPSKYAGREPPGHARELRPSFGRIGEIDAARGLALLGMIAFHFARDLEIFGYLPSGTTLGGGWAVFARLVAGSFIFLAGVSLILGHSAGLRWRPFLHRLAVVGGAAAAISVATFAAVPEAFIYYGILHSIAVSSLIGAFLLSLPAAPLVVLSAVAVALPMAFQSAFFDPRWLAWTGLSETSPRSLDFEPFFPWVAPFLIGMAAGKVGLSLGLWPRLNDRPILPRARLLNWAGRKSLIIYLVHQPILLGALWSYGILAG